MLAILTILLLAASGLASGISVSLGTDGSTVSTDLNLPVEGALSSEFTLNDGVVFGTTATEGPVEIATTISGGGNSAGWELSSTGGTLTTVTGASKEGIFGQVKHSEAGEIIVPEQVAYWSENPDEGQEVSALTYSGAVLHYTNLPYYTGDDPTYPHHTHGLTMYLLKETKTQNGVTVTWEQMADSIAKGMNTWNNGDGKVGEQAFTALYYTTNTNARYNPVSKNGMSGISWTNSIPTGVAAMTSTWYDTKTRHVTEADIGFNQNYVAQLFSDQGYRDSIAQHELGHVVGLKDTKDPGSVMYEYVTRNSGLNFGASQIWKYKVNY